MKTKEEEFKISVGNNIKSIRQGQNVSQGVIASVLGINAPAYSNLEAGKTDLSIHRLLLIATTLDVQLHQIVDHPLIPKSAKEIEELRVKYNMANETIIELQQKLLRADREKKLDNLKKES